MTIFFLIFINLVIDYLFFFFSSRRRHTRLTCDWSSDVCSSDLRAATAVLVLGDLDPAPVETRTIRDPIDQKQDVFEQVYARIARCVRELVTILTAQP